jgi:hypothetical protein
MVNSAAMSTPIGERRINSPQDEAGITIPSILKPGIPEIALGDLHNMPITDRPHHTKLIAYLEKGVLPAPLFTTFQEIEKRNEAYRRIRDLLEENVRRLVDVAVDASDTESAAETYLPFSPEFADDYYRKPEMTRLSKDRANLINGDYRPHNPVVICVDLQSAFGIKHVNPQVQKVISQPSYCEANLIDLANFLKRTPAAYSILTTMVHNDQTTIERWKQQKRLGLVDENGNFLLCPEGSLDIMPHPLLLKHLSFSAEEINAFETAVLLHSISSEIGTAFSVKYYLSEILKAWRGNYLLQDRLYIMEKPERNLSAGNLIQVQHAKPTDIFLCGVDTHVCVAAAARILALAQPQPNIWIISDLTMTRPQEQAAAREMISNLIYNNSKILLINSAEVMEMLKRGKKNYPDFGMALYYAQFYSHSTPDMSPWHRD